MYNFDETCGTIRDIVYEALKKETKLSNSAILRDAGFAKPEEVDITYTDCGLAITINEETYAIVFDKI